jgi:hypothetical protein
VVSQSEFTSTSSLASASSQVVHLALMYANPLVTRDSATGSYIPLESLYVPCAGLMKNALFRFPYPFHLFLVHDLGTRPMSNKCWWSPSKMRAKRSEFVCTR